MLRSSSTPPGSLCPGFGLATHHCHHRPSLSSCLSYLHGRCNPSFVARSPVPAALPRHRALQTLLASMHKKKKTSSSNLPTASTILHCLVDILVIYFCTLSRPSCRAGRMNPCTMTMVPFCAHFPVNITSVADDDDDSDVVDKRPDHDRSVATNASSTASLRPALAHDCCSYESLR